MLFSVKRKGLKIKPIVFKVFTSCRHSESIACSGWFLAAPVPSQATGIFACTLTGTSQCPHPTVRWTTHSVTEIVSCPQASSRWDANPVDLLWDQVWGESRGEGRFCSEEWGIFSPPSWSLSGCLSYHHRLQGMYTHLPWRLKYLAGHVYLKTYITGMFYYTRFIFQALF